MEIREYGRMLPSESGSHCRSSQLHTEVFYCVIYMEIFKPVTLRVLIQPPPSCRIIAGTFNTLWVCTADESPWGCLRSLLVKMQTRIPHQNKDRVTWRYISMCYLSSDGEQLQQPAPAEVFWITTSSCRIHEHRRTPLSCPLQTWHKDLSGSIRSHVDGSNCRCESSQDAFKDPRDLITMITFQRCSGSLVAPVLQTCERNPTDGLFHFYMIWVIYSSVMLIL